MNFERNRRLVAALEEVANGKALREVELTFYAQLADLSELKNARDSEHQEQWEIKVAKTDKNAGEGTTRVRMTIESGKQPVYTHTTKVKTDVEGDRIEVTNPTTEGEFKQYRVLGESGMKKDRFFFPIEGTQLVWEVDMFHKPGSTPENPEYHEWCKIDLEVEDREMEIPEFPMKTNVWIESQYPNRTPEEEKTVRGLYDTIFRMSNPGAKKS